MTNENQSKPKDDVLQQITLRQYEILVESLNKISETQEKTNNFWLTSNGVLVSILAYLREIPYVANAQRSLLFITLVLLGVLFCFLWISCLHTVKRSIDVRSDLLVKLEKDLPLSVFSKIFYLSDEPAGKAPLTVKQMFVPILFLISYLIFGILLFFFPQETMKVVTGT